MKDLFGAGKAVLIYPYGKHHHSHWEIMYYCEGTGVNTIDGVRYRFVPGTIICQPPFLDHEDISQSGFKCINIVVNDFDLSDRLPVIVQDTGNHDFLTVFNQIYNEFHNENDLNVTNSLLNILTIYISRRLKEKPLSPHTDYLKNEIINNFADPDFSILETIEKLPASKSHVRLMFENDVGMSPKEYLKSVRMEQAKKLMEGSSRLISEISFRCGYADPFYFSRIFRKHFGINPREWRKTQK